MLTEPTIEKLRAMRLAGMADALLEQAETPASRQLDFDERLGLLVDAEYIHWAVGTYTKYAGKQRLLVRC